MGQVFSTVTVARGETVTFTRTINTQDYTAYELQLQTGVTPPTLINNGTIQFSSSYPYFDPNVMLVGLSSSSAWRGTTIENNGTVVLEQTVGYAEGLVSNEGVTPGFLNTGDLLVRAKYEANGLRSWGGPVTNTGHLTVEAGRYAIAIGMETPAAIRNSGEIVARTTGSGFAAGISLQNGGLRLENDGLILATHSDPGATAMGVRVTGVSTTPLELVNRGTITADDAILDQAPNRYPGFYSIQHVDNSGVINGRVTLGLDDDTVVNSGRINGAVDLGADNDLYDGRLGSVVGMVAGGDGADTLLGGQGFDYLHGNAGADSVSGGAGDDWVVGGKDDDVLSGDAGDDVVYSNLGNDTLSGGDGADWVRGGQGDDSLSGGAGNDWMSGDRGDDTISGGGGADLFNTFVGAGIDRVLDFSLAQGDRVHLEAATPYTVTQSGGNTILDLGAGDQIILVGVSVADSVASWLLVG